MIPSRVEYLLMMAKDYKSDGDDIVSQQNVVYIAHAKKLADMWAIAEETRLILQEEMKRFNRWLPEEMRQQAPKTVQQQTLTDVHGQPMPRVVRQGPREAQS